MRRQPVLALLAASLVSLHVANSRLPLLRASETIRSAARASERRDAQSRLTYEPGQVVVQFRRGVEVRQAEQAMRSVGGVTARGSAFAPPYLVTLETGRSVPAAVDQLRSLPEVDYAEPNHAAHAFRAASDPARFTPNDRLFFRQWHFKMLDAERTWGIQKGDPSVVIAVLDSGIAYEDFGRFRKAPDWGGTTFVTGFNAYDGSAHANDDNFHGTHVASTIAEATNNGEGVAGLAFGCALMPVKVLDSSGDGFFFDVAEGVDFAVGHGAKVINLSLGGDFADETLRRAIERAIGAGVVVVAAAGNDGRDGLSFPASMPGVIAVGAVDVRKHRAAYSNFGKDLDVVAPGGDLDRDDDGDGRPDGVLQQTFDPDAAAVTGRFDDFAYFFVDGTSSATPHVAALAGLLIRQGITNPAAVKAAIESTAEDLGAAGRDDHFGHGLIRPAVALKGLGLGQ